MPRFINPRYEGPLPSDFFVRQHPDYCLEQGQRCAQWFEGVCLRCGAARESNPMADEKPCYIVSQVDGSDVWEEVNCAEYDWPGGTCLNDRGCIALTEWCDELDVDPRHHTPWHTRRPFPPGAVANPVDTANWTGRPGIDPVMYGPRQANPIAPCGLTPPFAPGPPFRLKKCVWLEWEGWRYAPKATAKDMARWSGEYDGRYRQPFRPEVFPRNVYAQGYREGQRHQRNLNVITASRLPTPRLPVPHPTVPRPTVPGSTVPRPTIPGPAVPGSTVPRPAIPGPAVPGRMTTRGFKCGYGAKLFCYPVTGGGQFCECCGTTTCYAPKVV